MYLLYVTSPRVISAPPCISARSHFSAALFTLDVYGRPAVLVSRSVYRNVVLTDQVIRCESAHSSGNTPSSCVFLQLLDRDVAAAGALDKHIFPEHVPMLVKAAAASLQGLG